VALGRKTGGRQAGTPNKRTLSIEQKLEALGCCPFEGMARLALDESQPATLRAAMFKELAEYVGPKRKPAHYCVPTLLSPPRAVVERAACSGDPIAIDQILAELDEDDL
jgi:hypothetical protein